jgi:hypothetical protein
MTVARTDFDPRNLLLTVKVRVPASVLFLAMDP